MNEKKKKLLTILICVLVVGGLLVGIQLIVNNANKSSLEYGTYVGEQAVKGNNNSDSTNKISNTMKNKIINKWKVLSTNTNDLKNVMYDDSEETLYLEYELGICVVDKENNIDRYVDGDLEGATAKFLMDKAQNDNDENTIYMTSKEFNNIIQ